MALPATVEVRISSEAAGYVSLTPVVVEHMALGELLEQIAGVTGGDAARIREILLRGTLLSGGSRLRWVGIASRAEELAPQLDSLPKPEPGRALRLECCSQVSFIAAHSRVEVSRQAAAARRLFRGDSLWAHLTALAPRASYSSYQYAQRADVYRVALDQAARDDLFAAADLLRYVGLKHQLRARAWTELEFHVPRRG